MTLNLRLMVSVALCAVLLTSAPVAASAQDAPADSASAPQGIAETPVIPEGQGEAAPALTPPAPSAAAPVVAELFTSQACIFCPQADRLFAELATQPQVIALACHIDYFDVRRGSLSKKFCTERQTRYAGTLASGPNYVPQVVVQGQFDAIGYKMEEIGRAMGEAAALDAPPLRIAPADDPDAYALSLPEGAALPAGKIGVWVAVYDMPHEVAIAAGRNKGQKIAYYNVVSRLDDLGPWKGAMSVSVPLGAEHKGFAVLLQDSDTGAIRAAGRYERPAAETPDAP